MSMVTIIIGDNYKLKIIKYKLREIICSSMVTKNPSEIKQSISKMWSDNVVVL